MAAVAGRWIIFFSTRTLRTLVPLVVGQSQKATQKRNPTARRDRPWDEASVLGEIQSHFSNAEFGVARHIAEWMKDSGGRLWFGNGLKSGSMGVTFTSKNGVGLYPIILWTYGRIEIQFQWMKGRPYFDGVENRRELMRRLNEIEGVNISEQDLTRRPSIALSVLATSTSKAKLVAALNWVVDQFRSA